MHMTDIPKTKKDWNLQITTSNHWNHH